MGNIVKGRLALRCVVVAVAFIVSVLPAGATSGVHWQWTTRSQRAEVIGSDVRSVSYTSRFTMDMAWKIQVAPRHAVTVYSSYSDKRDEVHVWHSDGSYMTTKDQHNQAGLAAVGWEYSMRTAFGGPLWHVQWQPGSQMNEDGTSITIHTVSLHWLYARIRDPVTVYVGAGAANDMLPGTYHGPRRPPLWTAQTGVVYALTRDVTVDGNVTMSWRGDERLAGAAVPGSRYETAQFALGATYMPSLNTALSLTVSQRLDQPGNIQLQFGLRLQRDA